MTRPGQVLGPPDLAGRQVLIPRPAGRSNDLVAALGRLGAQVQAVPAITIVASPDPARLDAAVVALAKGDFHWVAFTSVNAVNAVLQRAAALRLAPAIPADTRIAAVGPATARAIREAGLAVDLQPAGPGSATALADAFPAPQRGDAVLLPHSALAADTLANRLMAQGFQVTAVSAYDTVPATLPASVKADLADGKFDAVLFTSPSAVAAVTAGPVAASTAFGAIGPSTARALADGGHRIAFTAAEPTTAALIDGLIGALRTASQKDRA